MCNTQEDIQLILKNFKKFEDYTIKLPNTGIYLLNANIGSGKSTIFEAISYVLYDTGKNNCYPRSSRSQRHKNTTSVELIFKNGTKIYRQKSPILLTVTTADNTQLIGETAQQYINTVYGNIKSWICGGYLKQDENCAFFDMTANEKLEFLQEISIPTNFNSLLNTCQNIIHNYTGQLQETQTRMKISYDAYHKHYSLYSTTLNLFPHEHLWNSDELLILEKQYMGELGKARNTDHINRLKYLENLIISKLFNEIKNTHDQINTQTYKIKLNEDIKKQLDTCETELNGVYNQLKDISYTEETIKSKIQELELSIYDLKEKLSELSAARHISYIIRKKQDLEKELEELSSIDKPTTNLTIYQLTEFKLIIGKINTEGIYDRHANLINAKKYNIIGKIKDLRHIIQKCPKTSVSEEIKKIEQEIWINKLNNNRMTCPQCNTNLYIHNGQLFKCISDVENKSAYLEEKRKGYIKIEEKFKQIPKLQQQENYWMSNLEKLGCSKEEVELLLNSGETMNPELSENCESVNSEKDIDTLINETQGDISNISKITNILKLDVNVNEINADTIVKYIDDEIQKIKVEEQRKYLLEQIGKLDLELGPTTGSIPSEQFLSSNNENSDIANLKRQIDDNIVELDSMKQIQVKLIRLNSKLEELGNRKKSIQPLIPVENNLDELNERLERLIADQQMIKNKFLVQIYLHTLNEIKVDYEKNFHEEKRLSKQIEIYQKIKQTLISAEYVMLDSTLTQINIWMNEILNTIFRKEIKVKLRSLRKLKTIDRIKPEINVDIYVEDGESASLKEMSGGEKRLISMAYMIALSKMNKLPFLLLDESLSNLEVETKELVLDAISKHIHDRLVLVVNHEATEGLYDGTIHI